jgi:hypothetical protein
MGAQGKLAKEAWQLTNSLSQSLDEGMFGSTSSKSVGTPLTP